MCSESRVTIRFAEYLISKFPELYDYVDSDMALGNGKIIFLCQFNEGETVEKLEKFFEVKGYYKLGLVKSIELNCGVSLHVSLDFEQLLRVTNYAYDVVGRWEGWER